MSGFNISLGSLQVEIVEEPKQTSEELVSADQEEETEEDGELS